MIPIEDILDFLELDGDDENNTVEKITNGIISAVKQYCNRDFEETEYKDFISVRENDFLILPQFPVINIKSISSEKITILQIRNTNKSTYANVNISNNKLNLDYNGNIPVQDLTFATNLQILDIHSQISLIGNGWESSINSLYSDVLTSTIPEFNNKNAIDNNWVDIDCYLFPFNEYTLNKESGIIEFKREITGNFYINYTAGYAEIPSDLQLAIYIWISSTYSKHQETSLGLSEYKVSGLSKVLLGIPEETKHILNKYRKVNL